VINRLLLLMVVALFATAAINNAPAVWRGPPQMLVALDPETRAWVQALKNKFGGSCCDTADVFPVEVDGWDMAGTVDDTSVMTRVEAFDARSGSCSAGRRQMARRTQFRIDRSENQQAGYAVVWLLPFGNLQIHCFLPGSGG
jgi:hypothetical protein